MQFQELVNITASEIIDISQYSEDKIVFFVVYIQDSIESDPNSLIMTWLWNGFLYRTIGRHRIVFQNTIQIYIVGVL